MLIRRFFRHIKEGFIGAFRHIGNTISSATAVMITLLLIGLFGVLAINLNELSKEIESSISLSVLVDYNYEDQTSMSALRATIEKIDGVLNVDYRSKEEEFDYYVNQYEDSDIQEFYELYRDDNPFHNVFLVTVEDGNDIEKVKTEISELVAVDSVYDGGSSTYVLINVLNNVRNIGGILVVALCVLAIYLIYNTINLAISSRDKEIKIMRSVGASNSYIRGPFLVEGVIIGILGAILPIATIVVGYYYLYTNTNGILLGVITLLPIYPLLHNIGILMLLTSIVVGWIGSYISVCKMLWRKR